MRHRHARPCTEAQPNISGLFSSNAATLGVQVSYMHADAGRLAEFPFSSALFFVFSPGFWGWCSWGPMDEKEEAGTVISSPG